MLTTLEHKQLKKALGLVNATETRFGNKLVLLGDVLDLIEDYVEEHKLIEERPFWDKDKRPDGTGCPKHPGMFCGCGAYTDEE